MALRANKIAIIGDLHGKWNRLDNQFFEQSGHDLLIFVGDLGNGTLTSELQVIRQLVELRVPSLLMPGNNDAEFLQEVGAELGSFHTVVGSLAQGHSIGPVELCAYSSLLLETSGGDVTLIGARPCAMGGSEFSFGRVLEREYGITGMEHSVGRLKRLVDEATTRELILVAHNGPFGFGGEPDSPWARDFRLPEEMEADAPRDWGDTDLTEVIAYAKERGKEVLAVVAGHMHRHPRGGRRPLEVERDGTRFVNAAIVPRIRASEVGEHHHYVELLLRSAPTRAMERVSVREFWQEMSVGDDFIQSSEGVG